VDPSHSVASDADAKAGAVKLDGFLKRHRCVPRRREPTPAPDRAGPFVYGSLTTGIALQQPTPVHDAVVFGSPGMDINSVRDLKVPDGHTFSEMADQDYVPDADIGKLLRHLALRDTGHPPDEHRRSDECGRAVVGRPPMTIRGYLTDNSTSQYNVAAVVGGPNPIWSSATSPRAAPPETGADAAGHTPEPPPTPR